RLMVVAAGGQLLLAARLAGQRGAGIIFVADGGPALKLLSDGCRADLVLFDPAPPIAGISGGQTPRIARGARAGAPNAPAAVAAGASEYLPLPSDAEQAAALVAALARDDDKVRARLKIN